MPSSKDVMTSIFAIAVGAGNAAAADKLKPSDENFLYGGNVQGCFVSPSKKNGEKKTVTCEQDGKTKTVGISTVYYRDLGDEKAEIGLGVKNDVVTSYIAIDGEFMAVKSEMCDDVRAANSGRMKDQKKTLREYAENFNSYGADNPAQIGADAFGIDTISAKVCGPKP